MIFFYVLNISITVFFTVFYIFYYKKYFKLDLFNPLSIAEGINAGLNFFRIFFGPFFVLNNGLFNRGFQFSLLFTNVAYVAEFIQISLVFRFCKKKNTKYLFEKIKTYDKCNSDKLKRIGYFFLLLAILSFVLLAKHSFSVFEWIKSPRTGYQNHRDGAGLWYAFFLLFLSISFTFILVYSKRFLINFILLFFIIWLLGSKGQILYFFLAAYYFLWIKKSKYTKILLFMGMPIAVLLMLLNFRSTVMMSFVEYFDYYVNTSKFSELYLEGKVKLFWGKLHLTSFWGVLPRSLFPNKPYVYGVLILNEILWPGLAETGNTPAFGGPVMNFADFGFLGVFLGGLFSFSRFIRSVLVFYVYSRKNILSLNKTIANNIIFLYIFSPSFMTFFEFPINILILIFLFCSFTFIAKYKPLYKNYIHV